MNMMTKPATQSIVATRAMVAYLHIRQWSGHRLDREVTAELNRDHGAKQDAARVNKLLVPKEALAPIVKIAGEVGIEFRVRTLPWMQNGGRLLPAEKYLDMQSYIREMGGKFDDAVRGFIANYPAYQQQGKNALGTMYKPEDYPSVDELAGKFGLELKVLPVPSGKDFRIDLANDEMDRVRADVERQVKEAMDGAMKDIFERVAEVTGNMVERLTAYRPAKGKGDRSVGTFRDSLVTNVRDLVGILPSLNITGDPRIDDLTYRLEALARTEPKELRESKGARDSVRDEAERILKAVSDWM